MHAEQTVVSCGNVDCPEQPVINETAGLPPEKRGGCPTCGSKLRRISVSIQLQTVTATATMGALTASGGVKRDDQVIRSQDADSEVNIRMMDLAEGKDPAVAFEVTRPDGATETFIADTAVSGLLDLIPRILPQSSSDAASEDG